MKKILLILTLITVFLIIKFSGLSNYLTLENLQKYRSNLEYFVNNNFILASLFYILIYIIVVMLSIPGASVMSLAGGYFFKLFPGILYINFAAVMGATFAFLIARYIMGNYIQKKYADKLKIFNEEMDKNGHLYLLTLRFIPIFPFFMVNIFAALSNVKISTFIWTTAVGIFPASIVFTYAGKTLHNIRSLDEVISKEVFIAFVLLGILSQIPNLIKRINKFNDR